MSTPIPDSEKPNYQDAYIEALGALRDALTPAGIHMAGRIEGAELGRIEESDLLATYMEMPVGGVVKITATLFVPYGLSTKAQNLRKVS